MATTFESISLNGLRLSHLRQLASYVHARDVDGWYYGPKDQFEKRHSDIVNLVDSAVRYAESEGVKMPNNTIHEDGELLDQLKKVEPTLPIPQTGGFIPK